jgi:hypothetical protein
MRMQDHGRAIAASNRQQSKGCFRLVEGYFHPKHTNNSNNLGEPTDFTEKSGTGSRNVKMVSAREYDSK